VDTTYESIGLGAPVAGAGAIAGSISLLDYGSLPRNLERPDGLYGGQFGSTSPSDLLATGGWGWGLPPGWGMGRVRAGLGARLAVQQAAGDTLIGAGAMAGLLWDTPVTGLRVGTAADNLGSLAGRGNPLPISWAAGLSWAVDLADRLSAIWLADTRVAVDAGLTAGLGLEVDAFEAVALRAGWRGGGVLGGPTAGGGIHYPLTWFGKIVVFKLDYAMATVGELDRVHRFQVGVQFGGVSGTLQLGRIRVTTVQGEPVLRWTGHGPAYQVMVKGPGETAFHQLTDRPLASPELSLLGLPPGRYVFRIAAVDPYDAEWQGAMSPDVEVDLEGPVHP